MFVRFFPDDYDVNVLTIFDILISGLQVKQEYTEG